MHWTILSEYEVFANATPAEAEHNAVEEVMVGHARLILARAADGTATITRLISPHARDYLREDWQPGMPYRGDM